MEVFEEFKETFFQECEELLGDLELHLLALKDGSTDQELLHQVFRAIHSIKGGAGAFGFTRLIAFAHTLETTFDLVRSGKVPLTDELLSVALQGGDVLADLVRAAHGGDELAEGHESQVMADLAAVVGDNGGDPAADQDRGRLGPPPAAGEAAEKSGEPPALRTYHIAFRPRTEMLRRANEPLYLVRQLKELGDLTVTADLSALPSLGELEPTAAYLAWTFALDTAADQSTVEEVFEFVEDDCDLRIAESVNDTGPGPRRPNLAEPPTGTPKDGRPAAPAGPPADTRPKETPPAMSTVRVELDRVDRLGNMVGEIIITHAAVSQQIDQELIESHPKLVEDLHQLLQHTQNLQDSVMAIRAQPVRSIFARMPRLVRDLSQQTDKKVRLEMSGEGTEIDKTVIEQLSDPLTHLIRNAVDHGIEERERRAALGKPEEGTIHLGAEQRGNRIVIEITDDGGGINREKVQAIALERGLIAAGASLTDEEADSLILLPGFSTAKTISNISGRGVGLDVVNQNIRKLGGRVSICSEPDSGSTLTLTLPLTLAVLEGMVVRVGRETYIVPLSSIVESQTLHQRDIDVLPGTGQVLRFRSEYVKLMDLQRLLAGGAPPETPDRLVVLVELESGQMAGLMVDEILGQQQVVIKNLEKNFGSVPGIAGATILGDGNVALILDATAIRDLHDGNASRLEGRHKASPEPQDKVA